jgi:hypothetical protein
MRKIILARHCRPCPVRPCRRGQLALNIRLNCSRLCHRRWRRPEALRQSHLSLCPIHWITFAATFTDVWVISGSASKTVRINSIILCGSDGRDQPGHCPCRHSTADTGGTSAAFTAIPLTREQSRPHRYGPQLHGQPNPRHSAFGNASVRRLNVGTAGNAGCQTWTFGPPPAANPSPFAASLNKSPSISGA